MPDYYNPLDWYWEVEGKIYSSRTASFVSSSDDLYVKFCKTCLPTRAKSYNELMYTLRGASYPALTEQLDSLYNDKTNNTSNWESSVKAVKERYPYAT